MNSVMVSHSSSSKEQEVERLRKTIISLEGFVSEQKKSLEGGSKLLESKEEELGSLETSNAMLRKQIIASINHEENSRKEALEARSKSGSMILQSPRSRHTPVRFNQHNSIMNLSKKGRTA